MLDNYWQKVKTNYFEFNLFLRKNLSLLFLSIFKSFRTYIYVYVIPIIFLVVIYVFQSYGGINKPLPPIVAGYLLIPGFGIGILINTLISEWKASIFLKRINILGTNKWQFLLSIWIVGYILGMSAILLGIFIMLILGEFIGTKNSNIFLETFSFFNYGSSTQVFMAWFGFFLGCSIVVITSIGIASIIAGALRSVPLCQSLTILILIVCIPLSDLFLGPTIMGEAPKVFIILSYLIPQKYGAWATFLSVAGGNIDYILANPGMKTTMISFTNLYGPIFGGLGYGLGLLTISFFTFNWNNRG
ncbi:putative ABC transporter permease [Spiroplasma syrphidicola EA-1]|uniref:Putative ABC transporter permease n=1 Tax=Spiroplasma syrphidicola EA-1 TaxID=1276229 RepID=R4UM23_9MOLU|nr:hypothetical protein [Spiroplasma syrphidicola]AGM26281.1 putative ABC transporter permease [Spiroplasma syrphidicola EA-1]